MPMGKAAKHYGLLNQVKDILVGGYMTSGFQNVPFRSLEQAARFHPVIDTACDVMKQTSYTSLWNMLIQTFPKLGMTSISMIGERKPEQAMEAAQRLCGKAPMNFDYVAQGDAGAKHLKHHPLIQRVLAPGYQYFYRYFQLFYNIFMDAGKTEPVKWASDLRGITYRGTMYERICHCLLKLQV